MARHLLLKLVHVGYCSNTIKHFTLLEVQHAKCETECKAKIGDMGEGIRMHRLGVVVSYLLISLSTHIRGRSRICTVPRCESDASRYSKYISFCRPESLLSIHPRYKLEHAFSASKNIMGKACQL